MSRPRLLDLFCGAGGAAMGYYNRRDYPDLVATTRGALQATAALWVIENVPQAPLRSPIRLCGPMFGLKLYRERDFEASTPLPALAHPPHIKLCTRNGYLPTATRPFMSIHGGKHSRAWQRKAAEYMGVPWMTTIRELCEAIPPAYAEYVGRAVLAALSARGRDAIPDTSTSDEQRPPVQR